MRLETAIRNTIFYVALVLLARGCSSSDFLIVDTGADGLLSVPVYFAEHLELKESQINTAIQSTNENYGALIFFTDAHWGYNEKNSPALINHLYHFTPIHDVVFGGDVITTSFDDPKDAIALGKDFRQTFDKIGCNMYYLYGNHDNNSDGHPNEAERHLSEEQVFDYLQKGMGECIYGGYYNFYFDRPESKTRFLCLDTGRYYYSQFREKTIETVRYLIEVLKDTPDGWQIVLLSHLWAHLDSEGPYLSSYMKTIIRVLDDYNAGRKGTFRYLGDSVQYDFSEALSKIICCIGGHCHLDATLFSDGGIPIIITTADRKVISEEKSVVGTIEEQAISVFVFDYERPSIKMIRIGRGDDIEVPIMWFLGKTTQ